MLPFQMKKTSPQHKSPLNYFEPKTRNGDNPVVDPDLQIREWGPGGATIQALTQRGGRPHKNIFRPFGPHFGLKIRRGGPLPWIRHCNLVPRPSFLENWRSDPTSGLPFSKGKTMAKRLGMMPECIKYYFLCLFPEPVSN